MNRVELFFNAVQQGQLETVEAQLKTNPELANVKDVRGFTPLIFASYFDKKDIVETLLKHNASVDDCDGSGNTALIGVAFKGNTELTNILIKAGANINAINNLGYTPLIFATMYNQEKVVKLLLKHNADKFIKDKEGKLAIDYAKEKSYSVIVNLLS